MDTALDRPRQASFALRLIAWSLALFGLLRLPWVGTHLLLPVTRLQAAAGSAIVGPSSLPIEATLACSGADALALCLAAIVAYPAPWRMRAAGAAGGAAGPGPAAGGAEQAASTNAAISRKARMGALVPRRHTELQPVAALRYGSSSARLAGGVNAVSESCAIAVARFATSTEAGALRLSMNAQVAHEVTTMPPPAACTSASRRRDI